MKKHISKKYSDLAFSLQKHYNYKFISVWPSPIKGYNVSVFISMDYAIADNRSFIAVSKKFEDLLNKYKIKYDLHDPFATFEIKVPSIKLFIGLLLME